MLLKIPPSTPEISVNVFLTWCLDIQPAGAFNFPAEEKVLQTGGVRSKNVGEGRPLQVGRQSWKLGLQ